MNQKPLLEAGKYYHIYNRGNNGQNIFFDYENYIFFLNRYDQYLSAFYDTIAWVLLRNHFHLLIYIKPAEEINIEKLQYTATEKPKKLISIYNLAIFSILMRRPSIKDTTEPEVYWKKILKEKRFLQLLTLKN